MAKKNNMRKYAAVALGIVGVAGLSLASAAQLTVNTEEIAVGSKTFAACDTDGINVAYNTGTFAAGALPVTGLVVGAGTGAANQVAAGCAGKLYTVSVLDASGNPLASQTYNGTITLTSGAFTVPTTALSAAAVHGVVVVIK